MARKTLVMVGVRGSGHNWQVTIQTGDVILRAEIAGAIEHAKERGLAVRNSTDPLEGLSLKPRKAKGKKAAAVESVAKQNP